MGREVFCHSRWTGGAGDVNVVLESTVLIIRGDLRRTIPLSRLTNVHVRGDELVFMDGEERISLSLGYKVATSWVQKIATPPSTLAQKLGINSENRALVIGEVMDPALIEALHDAIATSPEDADLSLAVVEDEADVLYALAIHESLPAGRSIWIVNRKGPTSPYGENAIRTMMRERGYMDSKTSAVSDVFSATRYARK